MSYGNLRNVDNITHKRHVFYLHFNIAYHVRTRTTVG